MKSYIVLCLIFLVSSYDSIATDQIIKEVRKGPYLAEITIDEGNQKTYVLRSNAKLRDNLPVEKKTDITIDHSGSFTDTKNPLFDGLYAMALEEASLNCVDNIKDGAYSYGQSYPIDAFETGEKWTYVWTRDAAYSIHLALAAYDTQRSINSLKFKTSSLKQANQLNNKKVIVQDTGSGGSYPVSTDRIVWALGAWESLKNLNDGPSKDKIMSEFCDILKNTIEQDRLIIFDKKTGLYRGEQSFLDWREQSYPLQTSTNVNFIAASKTLSVNVLYYMALKITASLSKELDNQESHIKYENWAILLADNINTHLLNEDKQDYYSYLLSDGIHNYPVQRKDLLAISLAILSGLADQSLALNLLNNYPVSAHGPSVIWPQEYGIPIYHNQGIWPFVTAYWTKAAAKTKHYKAVSHGIISMLQLSALNLSNMENYDFLSGEAEVKGNLMDGPVVNSRRQLWSVAGYLSNVENIIFGAEKNWDGIKFQPFITHEIKTRLFPNSKEISLRNYQYKDTLNNVTVRFPKDYSDNADYYDIEKIILNGNRIEQVYINRNRLKPVNNWFIDLTAAESKNHIILNQIDSKNIAIYAPTPLGQESIKIEEDTDLLKIKIAPLKEDSNTAYNIYKNGDSIAKNVKDYEEYIKKSGPVTSYAIQKVDLKNNYTSHYTLFDVISENTPKIQINASAISNRGGQLINRDYFANWGSKDDILKTNTFTVPQTGRYRIKLTYSNGHGPINTGICCVIKKLTLENTNEESKYIIMPQIGSWDKYTESIPVIFSLTKGKFYSFKIHEDTSVFNMSYLSHNTRYTAWSGGGKNSCNYVNIKNLKIELLRD